MSEFFKVVQGGLWGLMTFKGSVIIGAVIWIALPITVCMYIGWVLADLIDESINRIFRR